MGINKEALLVRINNQVDLDLIFEKLREEGANDIELSNLENESMGKNVDAAFWERVKRYIHRFF